MLLMLLFILSIATYGNCQSNTMDSSQLESPIAVINTPGSAEQLVDCSILKFISFSPSILCC